MLSFCHSERKFLPRRNRMRRGIFRNSLNKITRAFLLAILASLAAAQESPTPSPSASPEQSVASSLVPEQTPPPISGRNVRISFVPPPMEGTISLGIYDDTNKLVRVLHQQAKLNEFAIGADALVTQWN